MNETPSSTAKKKEIDFESFMKKELCVGKILSAKAVPKTEKLLEFEVDLGSETRKIVSGVAPQFEPSEGKFSFICPADQAMPPGSQIS